MINKDCEIPKVEICLAVYNPNMTFLEKQLESLNNQTYRNMEVIIVDDYSENSNEIKELIDKLLKKIKFKYYRNEINLGCNKTFEKLISIAKGDYIAFCDQDDIWKKEKIEKYIDLMIKEKPVLIYSDLEILDENDNKISNSLKNIRNRVKHKEGYELWKYFLRMNSITGCTVLVNTEVAKKSLPIPKNEYVWDQWLSIFSSMEGKILKYKEPMIFYRIHSNNQIGAKNLIGINNKIDYIEKRVDLEIRRLALVKNRVEDNKIKSEIDKQLKKCYVRKIFLEKPSIKNLILNSAMLFSDYKLFLFEMALGFFKNDEKLIKRIKGTNN